MPTRKSFLKTVAGSLMAGSLLPLTGKRSFAEAESGKVTKPVALSTWRFGLRANEKAWEILQNNGRALDAVEQGTRLIEADPNITTVGLGGIPDRDGYVTLDACVMDENLNAGSVAAIQDIEHPVSVARLVMEKTPHVMLVGEGALQFAIEQGFKKTKLLTAEGKKEWEEWKKTSKYKPVINIENHDTIGMVALDKSGNLSGACTTSGVKFKMHGRVGDSPIIGDGLYVDNKIGAASSTGLGELVMRTCGSFTVVEMMRQGYSPTEACKKTLERIMDRIPGYEKYQVGYIALSRDGSYGGYAIHKGFQYAVYVNGKNTLIDAKSFMD